MSPPTSNHSHIVKSLPDTQLALQSIPCDGGLLVSKCLAGSFEVDPVLELFEESQIFYWHDRSDVFAMTLQYNTLTPESDIVYNLGQSNPCFTGGKTSHGTKLTGTYS